MIGQLKAFNPIGSKRDPQNYTDHQWITEDTLVCSTENGDVLVIDEGELKHVLPVVIPDGVYCLSAFSRVCILISEDTEQIQGFIAAGANGYVAAFEKTDDMEFFTLIRRVQAKKGALGRVVGISVSESEESAVCCFESRQIAMMQLSRVEVAQENDDLFNIMYGGFHNGPITGM